MSLRLAWVAFLALALFAPRAYAEDDDLLVPLTPTSGKKAKGAKKRQKPARSAPAKAAPKPDAEDDFLAPLTQPKSQLLVKIAGGVRGAKLFIDDRETGTLPAPAQELPVGEHSILVKRPGFADFARMVTVKEGQVAELNVLLEPISGVLSVTATQSGAQVFVDGQPIGQAPVHEMALTPGTHDVTVVKDGYAEVLTRLTVKPGRDYPIVAELRPAEAQPTAATDRPARTKLLPDGAAAGADGDMVPIETQTQVSSAKPWYGRWYVWAAVGAVVVAGATTAVAVRSNQPGEKNPTAVCSIDGPKECDGVIGADSKALSLPLP